MQKILSKYNISFPYLLLSVMLPIVGIYGSYNASKLSEVGSQTHFHVFWISILTALGIIGMFAIKSSEPYRLWLGVSGLAFITTLPKIFRASEGPIFHDEYAHYKTVEDLLLNGEAYFYNSVVNPAPMFHNMHSLVAYLSNLLNISVWTSAVTLTIFLHLVGLFVVALVIKQLNFSNTAVFLGTFIYAVNPNWMFFHSQFAYESFGIIFAIIGISMFLKLKDTLNDLYIVLGAAGTGLFGYWLAGLHHLSSIGYLFILFILLVFNIGYYVRTKSPKMKNVALLFSATFAGVGLRLLQDWTFISEYLFTPVQNAYQQLNSLFSLILGSEESYTRIPFEGGSLPFYEVGASYLTVIIYGLIFVAFLVSFIPKIKAKFEIEHSFISPEVAGFITISALYFVSILFILTSSGAEGARRSWGYIFLGLGVLAAWVWDTYATKYIKHTNEIKVSYFNKIVAIVLMPIMFLGGVSTGVNASYRFPVSVNHATVSDLTASSLDSRMLGEWFKNNVEPETWVLADRYAKLSLVANGRVQVPTAYVNFPYWSLYLGKYDNKQIEETLGLMYALGVKYVVVNSYMQSSKPELNFWFSRSEPNEAYNPYTINMLSQSGILVKTAIVGNFTIYEFIMPNKYAEAIDAYNLSNIMNFKDAKDVINFLEEARRISISTEGLLVNE